MQDMKLLGKGNTAEVFEYGNGEVCKLFFEGYPHEYVALEFQNAWEMYKSGIRVPKPFQMVTVENRKGILYERIEGRTLLEVMTEDEANLDKQLSLLVNLQLDIIGHHTRNVLSYKDYLTAMLKEKGSDNQTVFSAINALPNGDCLLHGDFHPNNILIMPDGAPVIIDFMNVCRGPALYDIARTYFIIKEFDRPLAYKYLKIIEVLEGDITEYLNIIEFCRQCEG